MARLPQPGGDEGNWGEILNEYLLESHTAGGQLKAASVGTTQLATSAVAGTNQVLGYDGTSLTWVANTAGVTDHGALNGLADDDHPQYHTDTRGDARYYTRTQVDSVLGGKANTTHAHAAGDISTGVLAPARLGSGTADTTTFLRGDGSWQNVPSGGGATNLSASRTATTLVVASDTGTDATLVAADGANAGVLTAADKSKLDGIASGAQVNTVTSVAAKTGAVTLDKSDVGLVNVDNTSDANKPISSVTQTALDGKASNQALTDGLATKANTAHTHDDRYFTETEIDTRLNYYVPIYVLEANETTGDVPGDFPVDGLVFQKDA